MAEFRQWRGFDIASRRRRLRHAFERREVREVEHVPLVINTPCYFGFGNRPMPPDYWTNPASMVTFQEDGFERHLSSVDDDTVPYFMPWFGTGVIASAFGCPMREATGNGDDPATLGACVGTVEEIARLRTPDPGKDGWMPRALEFIDYAVEHSDLPVGLTDMNSPLCTVAQMCGYDKLFVWMYEEPQAVHDLFDIVTETFIAWVKVQKEHIGEPLDASNGLQGVWSPKGVGVWVSDDDLVSIGPEHYEQFVVPANSRIFEAFGGGSVHFCGNGLHQVDNLLKIENIRAVNNSTMGDFDTFGRLVKKLGGCVTIQIQDAAPIDVESYYPKLFESIDDLTGIMLATFVQDALGLTMTGGTVPVEWDPLDTANRIVRTVRDCVRRKLAGEPPAAFS
ncbi:uroporphyrinogen decarboxylase family protein [Verrucomicrobiota bacterium]